MKYAIVVLLCVGCLLAGRYWQEVDVHAQEANCATKNGDVNGDDLLDMSDAIAILGNLFLGEAAPVPVCETQGPSGLPDTGQTKCYGAEGNEIPCDSATCAGQDGFYATGCAREGRFVAIDNFDDTVTDTCTGLMWQKDTGNDRNTLNWCAALEYCENLTFAGHEDWRLPNVRELQSIVDYGRNPWSIDPVFGASPNFYWSSTSVAPCLDVGRCADDGHPGSAWFVDFLLGGVDIDLRVGRHYVRAVRTAP